MIDFMVIALPRSGTTWTSNWLTTDTSVCHHDILSSHHYTEIDRIASNKTIGISDTLIFAFPQWLNKHPARKVILHRPLDEINKSLVEEMGGQPMPEWSLDRLNAIEGKHVLWTDIFDKPKEIYEYLLGKEFDAERHSLLRQIRVEDIHERHLSDTTVLKGLLNEINLSLR